MNRAALALLAGLGLACQTGEVKRPPRPPERVDEPAPADELVPRTAEPAATGEVAPAPAAGADSPSAAPPEREEPPLGWIAGQPLEPEELLVEWSDVASRELWLVIDKLVATRLALAEATRLGIRLHPEAVEQRYEKECLKLAREIERGKEGREASAGESEADPVAAFIEKELGFDPTRYLDRVRRATIRQMLAERAVRSASLSGESIALRLIVVADGDGAERVGAALAEGRDFEAVARELSIDDSKERGGLVPFVVPQERSPLARIAFQTPPGEVAGPLPVGEHQFWIRVEERRAPLEGDWTILEQPVEASLERHPVEDSEFVHWKLVTERRYPIDLGPLWSLIGAAR